MLFNGKKIMKDIVETNISDESFQLLEMWKSIYSGYYKEWHDIKYMTLNGTKTRRRHSLNMAKVSTEELAKLIFTEKVQINISSETHDENIENVLNDNRFYKVFQNKVEQMFALGGLVLKANPKELQDGSYRITINYVTPDCFIPTAWENEEITEGVFLNITRKDKKVYYLFEFHSWDYINKSQEQPKRMLSIRNELYESDAQNGGEGSDLKKVPLSVLYPDLEEQVLIEGLTQPLFQYIKPNLANNMDLQSPLGVSLFANALDTLYALDVAFDSFIREFKLGKRRIIVPTVATRTVIDPTTGNLERYFDADDEVYQAFNFSDPDKAKIVDNTVSLRVDEHINAINALLNIYAMQIGFSSGSFTFDGTTVKTATEVISENSKTYQTIKSNENLLEEGLIKFIRTISEVAALYDIFDLPTEDYDIDLYWDDSIIGDKYTDSDFYIKLNMNSMVSKKFVLMKILDMTEEQAEDMIEEVLEEQRSAAPDLNQLLGDVE